AVALAATRPSRAMTPRALLDAGTCTVRVRPAGTVYLRVPILLFGFTAWRVSPPAQPAGRPAGQDSLSGTLPARVSFAGRPEIRTLGPSSIAPRVVNSHDTGAGSSRSRSPKSSVCESNALTLNSGGPQSTNASATPSRAF